MPLSPRITRITVQECVTSLPNECDFENGNLNDNCCLSILQYSPKGIFQKLPQNIYFMS